VVFERVKRLEQDFIQIYEEIRRTVKEEVRQEVQQLAKQFWHISKWLENESKNIKDHYSGFFYVLYSEYSIAQSVAAGFVRQDSPDPSCNNLFKKVLCCICKTGGAALSFATIFGGVINVSVQNFVALIKDIIAEKHRTKAIADAEQIVKVAYSESDMNDIINKLAIKLYTDLAKKNHIENMSEFDEDKIFKDNVEFLTKFQDIRDKIAATHDNPLAMLGAYHGLYLIEAVIQCGILADARYYDFEIERTVKTLFDCLSATFPDPALHDFHHPAPQLLAENSHQTDNVEVL